MSNTVLLRFFFSRASHRTRVDLAAGLRGGKDCKRRRRSAWRTRARSRAGQGAVPTIIFPRVRGGKKNSSIQIIILPPSAPRRAAPAARPAARRSGGQVHLAMVPSGTAAAGPAAAAGPTLSGASPAGTARIACVYRMRLCNYCYGWWCCCCVVAAAALYDDDDVDVVAAAVVVVVFVAWIASNRGNRGAASAVVVRMVPLLLLLLSCLAQRPLV